MSQFKELHLQKRGFAPCAICYNMDAIFDNDNNEPQVGDCPSSPPMFRNVVKNNNHQQRLHTA
eukprot:6403967-Amphidinium_carterae.1